MTKIHYILPPEVQEHRAEHPGLALGPCLVCLMRAKGAQVAQTEHMWRPLMEDGRDNQTKYMPYPGGIDIREAVIVGICELFPGLLLPVCWDDLAGLAPPGWTPEPEPARVMPARGPLPPGLGGNGSHKRGRG